MSTSAPLHPNRELQRADPVRFLRAPRVLLLSTAVGERGHVTHDWPGLSLAFSQFHVGWQWLL